MTRRARRAVLLAPGAGSDSNHATLVALEAALAPTPVERMDFPYRLAGRKAPDRAPVLLAAVRDAAADLSARTKVGTDRLVLGGRSMGGRMCSMVAAERPDLEAEPSPRIGGALVLVSYPLHPPGKPDRLRIEHLPALDVPCLFISGDRDPFGTPAELEAATSAIPGEVTHHWIPAGRHDLKGADAEICEVVKDWIGSLD